MRVTYTINTETHSFETQQEEDLRELAQEIETHIREQHAQLAQQPELPTAIADGVLDSLADNSDEIVLGELLRPEAKEG